MSIIKHCVLALMLEAVASQAGAEQAEAAQPEQAAVISLEVTRVTPVGRHGHHPARLYVTA